MGKILWLDDDPNPLLIKRLRDYQYNVTAVSRLADAESLLRKNSYRLLILDVMIPLMDELEETLYASASLGDTNTGLFFFQRLKPLLDQQKTCVMVLTGKQDQEIKEAFIQAGLVEEYLFSKEKLAASTEFLRIVADLMARK